MASAPLPHIAPPHAPAAGEPQRIPALDGIRGLAILLVLVHHYVATVDHGQLAPVAQAIVSMSAFTFVGVDIFFVLSGFLIGGIILRNGHEEGFLKRFYVRRAARLLPVYLLVVALYAIASPYLLSAPTPGGDYLVKGSGDALPLWTYLTYLQNVAMASSGQWGGIWLAATWSLSVEEQFYLFAPVLLLVVPRRHLAAVLIGLALLSPVIRIALIVITENWVASYVLLPARWDSLIVGILGALAFQSVEGRTWMAQRSAVLRGAFFVLGAAMLLMMVCGLPAKHPIMITLGLSVVALFGLSLIAVALTEPGSVVARAMRNRQLVWLGGISYGVYLIHHPMLSLVRWSYDGAKPRLDDLTSVLLTLLALALTLALATLSWRFFEKPILSRVQSSTHRGTPAHVASADTTAIAPGAIPRGT